MPNILQQIRINATADKVYRALTTQEGLSSWWTTSVKAEAKVGAILEFRFGEDYHVKIEVINLGENKKVEWKCIEGLEEWPGTNISFELSEKDNMTLVKFAHSGWKEESDYFAMCNATWGHLLFSLLTEYVEHGKKNPYFKV